MKYRKSKSWNGFYLILFCCEKDDKSLLLLYHLMKQPKRFYQNKSFTASLGQAFREILLLLTGGKTECVL